MKLNALLLVLFAAALAACGGPTASGAPGGRPTISSFAADPATIQPGGSATLSWTVTGADALSVAPEVGAVTGSATTVSPAATTTYTLSASNDAGTTTARTTVTVASAGGGGDGGSGGGGGGGTLSAFFLPFDFGGEVSNTTFPDVAVDAAGGVHVAYEIADGGFDEPEPALYGYCPAECTDPSRFSVIPVGGDDDFLSDLNLRLDPQGHPRLSWSVYHGFRYAACDAGCTEPANWTVTPPLGSLVDLTDGSNRMFALDAEGRPRLIYTDDNWDH